MKITSILSIVIIFVFNINLLAQESTTISKAKEFRIKGFEAFDNEKYYKVREYCKKAIELDSTNTEKTIIVKHFFEIAKNRFKKAEKLEKEGEIYNAIQNRWDADLPLIFAFDFDYPNRKDIAKAIYDNRLILGDKVGADLYKKHM